MLFVEAKIQNLHQFKYVDSDGDFHVFVDEKYSFWVFGPKFRKVSLS